MINIIYYNKVVQNGQRKVEFIGPAPGLDFYTTVEGNESRRL